MQPTPLSNNEASPHLDTAVLENLRRQMPGRPEIIARIITSFLHTSPELLADVRAALLAGDPEAVRKAAHAMKSSNAQIGARQLAAMCHELEILGTMGMLLDSDLLLTSASSQNHAGVAVIGHDGVGTVDKTVVSRIFTGRTVEFEGKAVQPPSTSDPGMRLLSSGGSATKR